VTNVTVHGTIVILIAAKDLARNRTATKIVRRAQDDRYSTGPQTVARQFYRSISLESMTSPPLRVNSASSVFGLIDDGMNRTEPSANPAMKPPG
jgi:hypothetical protein